MATITDYRQQWRRDTAANLASDNPTPESGEVIFETDTNKFKIGDSSGTAYNALVYFVDSSSGDVYDVIDTDSADVAATTPTSPVNGANWTVVNSGSSGNHVTGLPNSIKLGDGRQITFKYDTTNTTWRYEDICIDAYSATGSAGDTQHITKYANGLMRLTSEPYAYSGTSVIVFAENFGSTPYPISVPVGYTGTVSTNAVIKQVGGVLSLTTSQVTIFNGTSSASWLVGVTIEGEW